MPIIDLKRVGITKGVAAYTVKPSPCQEAETESVFIRVKLAPSKRSHTFQ